MSKDFCSDYSESDLMRFWAKVEQTPSCWNWTAADNGRGYGVFYWNRRQGYAHRFSYSIHHGELKSGLEVDHLCSNRRCVNPDHLELTTHKINNNRSTSPTAMNARKTHCPAGHGYTEGNTRYNNGSRCCVQCTRDQEKIRARNKGVRQVGSFRPHNVKLDFDKAEEIRRIYAEGELSQSRIGEMFGVSQTVIGSIVRYETWKERLLDE